jgi:hypothetical protein
MEGVVGEHVDFLGVTPWCGSDTVLIFYHFNPTPNNYLKTKSLYLLKLQLSYQLNMKWKHKLGNQNLMCKNNNIFGYKALEKNPGGKNST